LVKSFYGRDHPMVSFFLLPSSSYQRLSLGSRSKGKECCACYSSTSLISLTWMAAVSHAPVPSNSPRSPKASVT
jgi:hypothetical protein